MKIFKKKEKQEKEKKQHKNPMDLFMSMGEKATGGDPERMALYNYLMMWVIFGAFIGIFIGNLSKFLGTFELQYLGWAAFGLAVLWFQYNSLTGMYAQRKLLKEARKGNSITTQEEKDDFNDFLEDFGKKTKKDTKKQLKGGKSMQK